MGIKKKIKHIKLMILDRLHLTRYYRRRKRCDVGAHTYFAHSTHITGKKYVHIGKYCSFANGVCIGVANHPYNILTTHPFVYMDNDIQLYGNMPVEKDYRVKRDEPKHTYIGNDVWIGHNATIIAGVKIGDGAIIGAGAVVTKDVEPYSIVGGVPAKHIKYRFSQDIINDLLEVKWWDLPYKFVAKLPFADVKKCIEIIKEYRAKNN